MTTAHARYLPIIRDHSQPLDPVPSGVKAQLKKLPDIKAVLFDVYGTLFVSASDELGTIDEPVLHRSVADALAEVGIELLDGPERAAHLLRTTILETHERLRATRVTFPEVDISEIWATALHRLHDEGLIRGTIEAVDVRTLALEFEVRSNPVWPMPGAQRCLTELASRGLAVGVVSNGQWFSPLLFPALLGGCLQTLGIPPDLQLWSYEAGEAKPSPALYERAEVALLERGIPPERVLVVGNDMLDDVAAAAAVGFRTALFAGDARSLRLHAGDDRVAGVVADLVVLNLLDIVRCVRPGE